MSCQHKSANYTGLMIRSGTKVLTTAWADAMYTSGGINLFCKVDDL